MLRHSSSLRIAGDILTNPAADDFSWIVSDLADEPEEKTTEVAFQANAGSRIVNVAPLPGCDDTSNRPLCS